MTTRIRLLAKVGLVCASCLAGMSNAQASDRLLKLLQLQTLNRTAPQAAPQKKTTPNDDSMRQNRGADSQQSNPQQGSRGVPGTAPPRRP